MGKDMDSKLEQMKALIIQLDKAAKAYYQDAEEIMSNYEYDKLYEKLQNLEKETGIVMAGSPTVSVGYEILSELPKENHSLPMLSLDKTKEVEALVEWIGDKEGVLSWKLDGLTIVLTYQNGELVKAVTRGNGVTGEVITSNAKTFKNLPLKIGYQGELILRGEAVIKYSDFAAINNEIEMIEAKYKNPRNLCSGSVRQLNSEITAKRNVHFFAFSLVKADDVDFKNSREEQRKWLTSMGFDVVEGKLVNRESMKETVEWFSKKIDSNDIPSDGLVLIFDDIEYGQSLGRTAKFPKDSIAFKWADEIKETELLEVEWSASRTGLINPVAIFDPVELEGTTVSRASLHNISIVENLELGIGDTVTVYKANMIIPQIAENLTRSGELPIPKNCPVCDHETVIKNENGIKALYCINNDCLAKKVKSFALYVSRDAMNIEGLSEATMEKLINVGIIKELADIYHLKEHKEVITTMEGFGEKSFQNMIDSIEKSRKTNVIKFLYSLGIPNIGLSNAKLICKDMNYDFDKIRHAKAEDLVEIQGVGEVIAGLFEDYFNKDVNNKNIDDLLQEVEFEPIEEKAEEQKFQGFNFVITGTVEQFANRKEVKTFIESKGGKVTGSVTSKTNYLVNNDTASTSSKNKKAKELGIPIIKEEELIKMLS